MVNRQSYLWVFGAAILSIGVGGCGSDGGESASTDYYAVSGGVSGYSGSGLVLQNNGGDDLPIDIDGVFAFATPVADGSGYKVSVKTQPGSPDGYCNVTDGSGTVNGGAVTGVMVRCASGLYNVIDTMQESCYNSATGAEAICSGTGYDADHSGISASYSTNSDGSVVIDGNTGLVWTQSADLTGNGTIDADDKLSQPDAVSYCASLDSNGIDWRLPTVKELYSLMDFRGGDPSNYVGTDTSVLTPFINDVVFAVGFGDVVSGERIIDGQYATSTLYVSPEGTINGAATMFGVNFIDGRIKGYPYDFPVDNPKKFYVYCVGGNPDYGTNTIVDNGDGTLSDNATNLMWQQDDYHSSNFDDAVTYCQGATSGDWNDWRLPNVKELQSIVDYERAPDETASAAINPLFNVTSFTNEEGETDWGYYWTSTTHAKSNGLGDSAAYVAFGRALGYFDGGSGFALVDVHGAGAQRSNGKQDIVDEADGSANMGYGVFYYNGPQGDILRIDNRARCVRGGDII